MDKLIRNVRKIATLDVKLLGFSVKSHEILFFNTIDVVYCNGRRFCYHNKYEMDEFINHLKKLNILKEFELELQKIILENV